MILQGVEFPIFLLIFEWALQQCSATALPVICVTELQISVIKLDISVTYLQISANLFYRYLQIFRYICKYIRNISK